METPLQACLEEFAPFFHAFYNNLFERQMICTGQCLTRLGQTSKYYQLARLEKSFRNTNAAYLEA